MLNSASYITLKKVPLRVWRSPFTFQHKRAVIHIVGRTQRQRYTNPHVLRNSTFLAFYCVTYSPFRMSAKHNVELKFSRSSKLGPHWKLTRKFHATTAEWRSLRNRRRLWGREYWVTASIVPSSSLQLVLSRARRNSCSYGNIRFVVDGLTPLRHVGLMQKMY